MRFGNGGIHQTQEIRQTDMTGTQVTLSDSAAKRIAAIVASEPANTMLRVSVEGGGCSGFQYKFDLVHDRESDDLAIEKNGITVLIDPVSVMYMEGSEIDFVDDLIGASFQVKNPNATAACGCGTSFSI
jgi:iron-sulfur cluster insertion protein